MDIKLIQSALDKPEATEEQVLQEIKNLQEAKATAEADKEKLQLQAAEAATAKAEAEKKLEQAEIDLQEKEKQIENLQKADGAASPSVAAAPPAPDQSFEDVFNEVSNLK